MTRLKSKIFNSFNLQELGIDFMGYYFNAQKELTYHHIMPKNIGGKTTFENGALLIRPSHNYIHLIENTDFKLFLEISHELVREHQAGEITKEHIIAIQQILEFFEAKYSDTYTRSGTPLIQEEYIRRRKKYEK